MISNVYHIFAKAESNGKKTIEHATANSLTGPYTFVQTGNFAGWGQAEGPSVTVLPNGQFRLYVLTMVFPALDDADWCVCAGTLMASAVASTSMPTPRISGTGQRSRPFQA